MHEGWPGGGTLGAKLRGHGCDALINMGHLDRASSKLVRPWLASMAGGIVARTWLGARSITPAGMGMFRLRDIYGRASHGRQGRSAGCQTATSSYLAAVVGPTDADSQPFVTRCLEYNEGPVSRLAAKRHMVIRGRYGIG
jgi:hypothetical protein